MFKSQNVSENSIFKTTWQLYKEIELHVARLCTLELCHYISIIIYIDVFVHKTQKSVAFELPRDRKYEFK